MTNSRRSSSTSGSISDQNRRRMAATQRRKDAPSVIWISLLISITVSIFSFVSLTYTNSNRNRTGYSPVGNQNIRTSKYAENNLTSASGNSLLSGSRLMTSTSGWDVSPIVLEEHKLIFFTIPKTGTTIFKLLFRRMMGFQNWNDMSKPDILPHHPPSNGLRYLYHFPRPKAEEMLTSKDWTKAIFVREPKDRLLSAYLDKVQGDNSWYIQKKCCTDKSLNPRLLQRLRPENYRQVCTAHYYNRTMSLMEFVRDFIPHCDDPHWQPQTRRLESKIWDTINFVGYFDTIRNDTKRLLQQIGAWDEYGSSGWSDDGTKSIFETNYVKHKTSAGDKFYQYFTPEVDALVNQLYEQDYRHPVMDFTITKQGGQLGKKT